MWLLCIEFIDFVLAGKKLTGYTNLLFPYDLKKNDNIILSYFKNSIEATDKTNLTNQTKFRLNKISKTENYFIEEINQRKSYGKILS